jgi:hypothetical protein
MMATYHLVRSISAGKRRERRIACLDDLVSCRCRVPSPTVVAGRAGRRSRCNASGASARRCVASRCRSTAPSVPKNIRSRIAQILCQDRRSWKHKTNKIE